MSGGRTGLDADQMVAALYRAHYGSLTRIATLLIGDVTAGEEMVQDAFASLYRARRQLRDGNKALGYLRQTIVSRARSDAATQQGLASSGPTSPGTPEAPLLIMLRRLPARQREALILKYYANWPDRQIAAAMGIRTRALYTHIRQGLSTLSVCAPRQDGPA